MIHQGSAGYQGTAADIEVHAREILDTNQRMIDVMAKHTGQSSEQVRKDIERDRFMTADESKSYGIIDDILEKRAVAEREGEALMPGEPTRIVREQEESQLSPVENPEG